MNKTKKVVIISCILAALGAVLVFVGIGLGGAITSITYGENGIRINTVKAAEESAGSQYQEDTVSLDSFNSIELDVNFGNLKIQESDKAELYYKIDNRYYFSYKMEGDCLKIEQRTNNPGEIVLFGTIFNSSESEIILSVPKGVKLNGMDVDLDSVEIEIDGVDTALLNLSLSFGNLKVTDSNLGVVTLDMDSANAYVENVTAQSFQFSNSFGKLVGNSLFVEKDAEFNFDSVNVDLEESGFDSLHCENSFGKINFKDVIVPVMTMDLDSVSVTAQDLASQSIQINNNFGNITLDLVDDLKTYGYDIQTEFGKIKIDDKDVGSIYNVDSDTDKAKYIQIICDSGSVYVN